MKFQVGDRVSWMGAEGEVTENRDASTALPVRFNGEPIGSIYYFLDDGRYRDWHKEPSLKLIERKEIELKRCPFCGSKARKLNYRDGWGIECEQDYCLETPKSTSVKGAIKLWNETRWNNER